METTLIDLITEGEHVRQDFKFKVDEQRKIARTLCAFANTEGGRLLIGINDKHKIVGCNPSEELNLIKNAASIFCKPEVIFSSKIWQEYFRLVLEIEVQVSDDKPHKAMDDEGTWRTYIRIKDQTTAVNKIIERVWFERKNLTIFPIELEEEEKEILKIIQEEQPITLSRLYKKAEMQLRKVDKSLVFLICRDLVDFIFEKEGIHYKIKGDKG